MLVASYIIVGVMAVIALGLSAPTPCECSRSPGQGSPPLTGVSKAGINMAVDFLKSHGCIEIAADPAPRIAGLGRQASPLPHCPMVPLVVGYTDGS